MECTRPRESLNLPSIQIVGNSTTSVSFHQAPYINQMCEPFDIQSIPPWALLMDPELQFIKEMGPPAPDLEPYCKIVGALIQLTNCTGRDICFPVDTWLGTRDPHWNIGIDLLRCVMGSATLSPTRGSGGGVSTMTQTLLEASTIADTHQDTLLLSTEQPSHGPPRNNPLLHIVLWWLSTNQLHYVSVKCGGWGIFGHLQGLKWTNQQKLWLIT